MSAPEFPHTAPAANVQASAPVTELWKSLAEIRISGRTARKNRISAIEQSKLSAPYDVLRTRALRIMRENGWKTLAVTSPNKSCGKTTVSVNLAFSLARQADLRIMLLDFDLRRPAMHRVLRHRPDHSLHNALAGKVPVEKTLLRVGENLAFGLNAGPATNPSELLQAKATRERIREIQANFRPDILIFDMPPMLVSDENFGFLPQVDCGLLVGAADSTTLEQLDICEKDLADLTNVLGVVLNKCRYAEAGAGYDYDYY